jgi:predicted PurR-regulated permease PerM
MEVAMETCLAFLAFLIIATIFLFGALIAWALISAIHEWLDPQQRAKRQRLKERIEQFQQRVKQRSLSLNSMVHQVSQEAAMILKPTFDQKSTKSANKDEHFSIFFVSFVQPESKAFKSAQKHNF